MKNFSRKEGAPMPTITASNLTQDQIKLDALMVAARANPRLFADLITAASFRKVRPHAFHKLMQHFLFTCFRAHKNVLIQAPPEHAKTSQIIPSLIWILAHDLTRKIGIVSRDKDLAEEHLMRVRKALTSATCASVFPQIVPDYNRSAADQGEWSKQKLYLVGQSAPAFECYSLFGQAEGHRLDTIWLDDCVTRNCLYSEAERRHVASAIFDTFANRLTDNGILLVTNNCWHREDAVHKMAESPSFATLWLGYENVDRMYFRISHPPEGWNEPTEGFLPLWDQWPKERLIKKRDEPGSAWKRLFEGKAISPEDVRFPGRDKWARWNWNDLTPSGKILAFLDPTGGRNAAKGDYGALILVLRRPDGTHDLIDCWVDRRPPEDQIAACFTLHEKWVRLGFHGIHRLEVEMLPKEELWIRKVFEARQEQLRKEGSPYWQLPWDVRHPSEPKDARIERIGPPLIQGWLRFPADLEDRIRDDYQGEHWRRLTEQLEEWPFNDHDDAPDALAGAMTVDQTGGVAIEEDTFAGVGIF